MKRLKDYIKTLLARGKHFFTKQEALSVLGLSESQFKYQAYRLSTGKSLKRLIKDFYMIIPDEYRNLGSLPPHWIVGPLMRYLDQDYYIGLLSAASLLGATEQQPMVFQVITSKRVRKIELERGSIEFHECKRCLDSLIGVITTPTGYVRASRPEQTMLDLIRFYESAGYFSNVAAVIKELAKISKSESLVKVIVREKVTPILQRLGYTLEIADFPRLAETVEAEIKKRSARYVLLRPDSHEQEGEKSSRWKLILNDVIELS